MAKDYTVKRAFQGTVSKEDKTPQVIDTRAGQCHKFIVQFEGQEDKGWIQILRKIENGASKPVTEGEVLYGDLTENNYGKWDFKRMQRPDGQFAPKQGPAPAQNGSKTLEDKIDHLTALIENFLRTQGVGATTTEANTKSFDDIDDAPVDFSELDI